MLPGLLPYAVAIFLVVGLMLWLLIRRLRAEQPEELVVRAELKDEDAVVFAGGVRADLVVALAIRAPRGEPLGADEQSLRASVAGACAELEATEPVDKTALSVSLGATLTRKIGREVVASVEKIAVRA